MTDASRLDPIQTSVITELLPGFFQGGVIDGMRLPDQIEFVLSLYVSEKWVMRSTVEHLVHPFPDDSTRRGMPSHSEMEVMADLLNARAALAPVLVHCQAGLNRSAMVAALALMRGVSKMTACEAIELIRLKRGTAALFNQGFVEWLFEYEREQLGDDNAN